MRVLLHFRMPIVERLLDEIAGLELVTVPTADPVPADVTGDVLLTLPWGTPNLADVLARGVRWVHSIGTGVDGFPLHLVGDRILTCSRGASAVPIAEWVLAMMLAFAKQLPATWISAPPPQWNQAALGTLAGRTLGLVGIGGIGTAIATRALAFGMRVVAVRRTPAPSPVAGVEIVPNLADLLAVADHVAVVAPSTAATRHLIDAAAFAAMKPGTHLVNVARGTLVDQDALRVALDDGRVARASLDTVDPEPLPEGHWLYTHPQVRLSAHVSWSGPDAMDRLLEPFVENVRRWSRGDALLGEVDLGHGY